MKIVNLKTDSKAAQGLDESMIPAINIVFLLLIFFMIAGHIEARSDLLQVPASATEENLEAREIEIKVSAQGEYFLNGVAVEAPLLSHLQALNLSPETLVVCYVDRNLAASALDPILRGVRQLGIKQLMIATVQQP